MNKIIVTGGVGFIGSALISKLNEIGETNILIVDSFGKSDKWKNIIKLKFDNIINKDEFLKYIYNIDLDDNITLFHLGACSQTTNSDNDYLFNNNFKYTTSILEMLDYKIKTKRFKIIYASSSATYGNGENTYSDTHDNLYNLNPLNMYAYSKHLFDLFALEHGYLDYITGLKFFNVFGPNEYHKGNMQSIICKQFEELKHKQELTIFKAYSPEYKDGDQLRDFIYIKDVVDVLIYFYQKRELSGIYNVGTGIPRSWNDLCNSAFKTMSKLDLMSFFNGGTIHYEDMPDNMKNKYQNYTCADITKLRNSGYDKKFLTLEESVEDYITNYLNKGYLYL
jgi:ADP-L-glycero-D-manno-heptose 6-epimerase